MLLSSKRWGSILLFVSVALFCLYPSHAGSSPLTLRASVGVVNLPLHDWSRSFSGLRHEYYRKNNPNVYYGLCFNYALSRRISVDLETELIRTTTSLSGILPLINVQGDTVGSGPFAIVWHFQGVPITLGYEYKFNSFSQRFAPVAGIGISYFISKVETEYIDLYGFSVPPYPTAKLKRTGNGYGFHVSVGLISMITQSLSIISRIRYRFADGMALSGSKSDVKVQFTGLDFSMGIGWTF